MKRLMKQGHGVSVYEVCGPLVIVVILLKVTT